MAIVPFKSDKPKPPELDAPMAKKSPIPFGAKHEAAEPPKREASEETASAKLAYIKGILQDALMACGEDDEPEMEESPEMETEEA